jgi:phage regulator Rha-like protein
MYENFEEKEYKKEEETSGKNWSKARRLSLLAMNSHTCTVVQITIKNS